MRAISGEQIGLTDAGILAEEGEVDGQGIFVKTDYGFDALSLMTPVDIYHLFEYQDGTEILTGSVMINFATIRKIRRVFGRDNLI